MKPGYYSEHFSRLEMRASDTAARRGWPNTPPPAAEANLERLCRDYLEPLRDHFGPIRVTSGYRSPELNAAIGGSRSSAHCQGRAGDLQVLDPAVALREVVEWVTRSRLDYDQVIYEFGAWVHFGIAAEGNRPRRQALMIFKGSGYLLYDPADPRVA